VKYGFVKNNAQGKRKVTIKKQNKRGASGRVSAALRAKKRGLGGGGVELGPSRQNSSPTTPDCSDWIFDLFDSFLFCAFSFRFSGNDIKDNWTR
jgi:hypothetical protein